MDCVVSGKDKGPEALFVLTERKTRYEIIRKISDQTANSVVKELNRLEHQFGSRKVRNMYKTITCDNENANSIIREFGARVLFNLTSNRIYNDQGEDISTGEGFFIKPSVNKIEEHNIEIKTFEE